MAPFVGRKRKKIWYSILLYIFWTVWKERNRLAFRGGSLDIQKLKNFFVCNLWSWVRVYMGEESSSLLVFFGVASGYLRAGEAACSFVFELGCVVYSLYTLWLFAL